MLPKERLHNNFDFLRVFAALCITFTHSYNLLSKNNDEPLIKLTGNHFDFSFIGLSIFFSISGYLIAKSAARSPSFKNYIWKRFLRIQPMLILVCLITVFIVGPLFSVLSLKQYFKEIATYTYLRNIMPFFGIQFSLPKAFAENPAESGVNGSLWSLIVEERLYLIIGIIFFLKKYGQFLMLVLIAALNFLYFVNILFYSENLIKYFKNESVFYALIFLNAAACCFLNINFIKREKNLIFYYIIIAGGLILSPFCILEKFLQIILIPILILWLANLKGKTNQTGKYGDFTYGIYILSFPVQQMIIAKNTTLKEPLELFGLTVLVVIPLAVLCWHLLEKKMSLLKNRLI